MAQGILVLCRCVRSELSPRARFTLAAGLFLGLVSLPRGGAGQIPGGRSVDPDRERATFRATVLNQIRPVMDAWEGAWRGDVGPSIGSFYTPDAVVAIGDSLMGGSPTLANFARSARRGVAALAPSMLDFDAAERLAYVYGAWNLTSSTGDRHGTGRMVTLLRKSGGEWRIRSQIFGVDSVAVQLLRVARQADPLPSLERRVAVGAKAVVPAQAGQRERQDARTIRRIAVYRELIAALATLRSAWSTDDQEALISLLRDDAWLQLPGVQDWAGRMAPDEWQGVLSRFGSLYTVELDFDYSGTMAYLSGRYYAELSSAPARSGSYVAVFQNLGSGWLIRSLLFF